MHKIIEKLGKKEMKDTLQIQSAALFAIHGHMWSKGITQVMPVLLSTITDPLNHSVYDASIDYGGQELSITKSMILHKQVLVGGGVGGIYIVSPNVRLEKESMGDSGRHLFEFSQVDIELADATAEDFMKFGEELFLEVLAFVRHHCEPELSRLGRDLPDPDEMGHFRAYDSSDLLEKYGEDFEKIVSRESCQPFWITNLKREFYDREDPTTKKQVNYDLVYPEGFGEALSGGERETEYDTIIRKMRERGTLLDAYTPYLEFAKSGHLRRSAGGGFGVERLVRYLTGRKHIREVVPFERVPGSRVIM